MQQWKDFGGVRKKQNSRKPRFSAIQISKKSAYQALWITSE